jgi:hypothetical protein
MMGDEMKFSEMSSEKKMELMKGIVSNEGGKSSGGRKEECLKFFREGFWTTLELSKEIGVSSKNVGCLINYLKNDGYLFNDWKRGKEKVFILVGKIVKGELIGNRIEECKGSMIVKFNIESGKFEDEVVKVEESK